LLARRGKEKPGVQAQWRRAGILKDVVQEKGKTLQKVTRGRAEAIGP